MLMESGISGPFGLALSSDVWTGVVETTEHGGYPLFEHLRQAILGGPIVWAPGIEGAVVLSQRGGDFVFESGQDLSIGYLATTPRQVTLYLEESFTFMVVEPDAAVALRSAVTQPARAAGPLTLRTALPGMAKASRSCYFAVQ